VKHCEGIVDGWEAAGCIESSVGFVGRNGYGRFVSQRCDSSQGQQLRLGSWVAGWSIGM